MVMGDDVQSAQGTPGSPGLNLTASGSPSMQRNSKTTVIDSGGRPYRVTQWFSGVGAGVGLQAMPGSDLGRCRVAWAVGDSMSDNS